GGEMAAESARAGHGMAEPEHVARDRMEPRAARDLALDIGHERERRRARRVEWRGSAEQLRVDVEKPPGLLIGRASHHDAVDMIDMRGRGGDARNAAVDDNGQRRMGALEAIDAVIVERWDVPVLPWREAIEPGLARMTHEPVH